MAIWGAITNAPVDATTIGATAALTIIAVTLFLIPRISTAILRLSLRLSPLPIGEPATSQYVWILGLAWLFVVGALVASGSEWITLLVAALVGICGMARAYRFRRRWKGFPRGRTVLFLRRFGKTADRVVSTAIRRAMPMGSCLAFLVGSRQAAASWDPLVVAFDGLNRHALPHYLSSTDTDWVVHVKKMVAQADAVVLDGTDWSEALDTELAIVDACQASERLIVLVRHGERNTAVVEGRNHLIYRASWRAAGHRMFWGLMLTLVPAVIGENIGWSFRTRVLVSLPALLAWLCLAVRPLMDAASTNELARRLASLSNRRVVQN